MVQVADHTGLVAPKSLNPRTPATTSVTVREIYQGKRRLRRKTPCSRKRPCCQTLVKPTADKGTPHPWNRLRNETRASGEGSLKNIPPQRDVVERKCDP